MADINLLPSEERTAERIDLARKKLLEASIADKILSTRSNLPSFFSQLEELVPQSLYFSDLRLSADKVVISGKARSSADMAGFVTGLSSQKGAQIVSNVTIDSLSSDESGAYTFVVSAQLVGK